MCTCGSYLVHLKMMKKYAQQSMATISLSLSKTHTSLFLERCACELWGWGHLISESLGEVNGDDGKLQGLMLKCASS